jgi:metal-responsive CopG/Arc/MetJ family transcriptional regulator
MCRDIEDTMQRKNIRLPDPQIEDLEQMSAQKGVKLPELVRRAVDEYLERWKRETRLRDAGQ